MTIHRLVLNPDVEDGELETLVANLYPDIPISRDRVRFSEYSTLERRNAHEYLLITPRRRDEAPDPGMIDRDGLVRAFPGGMPFAEERELLSLIVAIARRLGGTVVTDAHVRIHPHADQAPGLTIISRCWAHPDLLEQTVREILPEAELDIPWVLDPVPDPAPEPERQPEREPGVQAGAGRSARRTSSMNLIIDEVDATTGVIRLEETADEIPTVTIEDTPEDAQPAEKAAAAAATDEVVEEPLSAYRILAPSYPDADFEIVASGHDELPPALRRAAWAQSGYATYTVRYLPMAEEELEIDTPDPALARRRDEVYAACAAVAARLYTLLGGAVLDEMGFLVDPEELGTI